ncbi:MAG: hypothetical protein J1F13_07180, partial [Prevotellaceae bacterium]|nr:hypothetical protein [Prevotellaceae bacterium]
DFFIFHDISTDFEAQKSRAEAFCTSLHDIPYSKVGVTERLYVKINVYDMNGWCKMQQYCRHREL